jgi:hypothetical protein
MYYSGNRNFLEGIFISKDLFSISEVVYFEILIELSKFLFEDLLSLRNLISEIIISFISVLVNDFIYSKIQ